MQPTGGVVRAVMQRPSPTSCKPTREAAPPGKKWIFRSWMTLPDGRRIYAKQYGKHAFALLVDK